MECYNEDNSDHNAEVVSQQYKDQKAGQLRSRFQKIIWLWGRLRCMTSGEILYRCQTMIKGYFERIGIFTAKKVAPPDISRKTIFWLNPPNCDKSKYIDAANTLLRGKLKVFDIEYNTGSQGIQWNRDPLTGLVAPLDFGKSLNYRNEQLVGDIKYLWEPARHLQLVTLAQAYHLSGSDKYLTGIRAQVESWIEQCPYLLGPHWSSSLELAVRLINWSLVWQLIGGLESPMFKDEKGILFRDRWLTSIYQHVHFIQSHFSEYSSANNHLIGEASGLFVATTSWPFWSEFSIWQSRAADILEREIKLQHTCDGVNREQAISYQQFVLDFLLLAFLTGRANQYEFSSTYLKYIEKMLDFLASVMDVSGHIPMIGDADDGFVVCLSQEDHWCPYRSLLATGCVLFKRSNFKAKAHQFDHKSHWLLGDKAKESFTLTKENTDNLPVSKAFKQGGYYILGDNFETDKEVRIVSDAGPLGYLGIAAHGHADALSMTLSAGGKEILIDPGTFAYHTRQKWRNYFRGTAAHNTIRIDDTDQSTIAGNFMWKHKANARCEEWQTDIDMDRLVSSHDGYLRLEDPTIHKRSVQYNKRTREIFIYDYLDCKETHQADIFWHFAEQCSVKKHHNFIQAFNGHTKITLKMLDFKGRLGIFRGQESPPLGWISRKFCEKLPTTTALWSNKIQGPTELITVIKIEFNKV